MDEWELREVEFEEHPPIKRVKVWLRGEWRWLTPEELAGEEFGAEILAAAGGIADTTCDIRRSTALHLA